MAELLLQPFDVVLGRVMKFEDIQALRYADWSRRFAPFDHSRSTLLQYLAEGARANVYRLAQASADGSPMADILPDAFGVDGVSIDWDEPESRVPEHFFVIDAQAAHGILRRAIETERDMAPVYRQCGALVEPEALVSACQFVDIVQQARLQLLEETAVCLELQRRGYAAPVALAG